MNKNDTNTTREKNIKQGTATRPAAVAQDQCSRRTSSGRRRESADPKTTAEAERTTNKHQQRATSASLRRVESGVSKVVSMCNSVSKLVSKWSQVSKLVSHEQGSYTS
jgi:hypothetical protein